MPLGFQPDGFDAYDLSPVTRGRRPDLSPARVFRYRSPDWQVHFQKAVFTGR